MQQIKLWVEVTESHISMSVGGSEPLFPILLPASASWEVAGDGPSTWVPATVWDTWIVFPALGFTLGQPNCCGPLWRRGEGSNELVSQIFQT